MAEGEEMKQPDRWERTAEHACNDWEAMYLSNQQVVKLLRQEHAWVRRMVKAVSMIKFEEGSFRDGVRLACEEIEHRLKERAR